MVWSFLGATTNIPIPMTVLHPDTQEQTSLFKQALIDFDHFNDRLGYPYSTLFNNINMPCPEIYIENLDDITASGDSSPLAQHFIRTVHKERSFPHIYTSDPRYRTNYREQFHKSVFYIAKQMASRFTNFLEKQLLRLYNSELTRSPRFNLEINHKLDDVRSIPEYEYDREYHHSPMTPMSIHININSNNDKNFCFHVQLIRDRHRTNRLLVERTFCGTFHEHFRDDNRLHIRGPFQTISNYISVVYVYRKEPNDVDDDVNYLLDLVLGLTNCTTSELGTNSSSDPMLGLRISTTEGPGMYGPRTNNSNNLQQRHAAISSTTPTT